VLIAEEEHQRHRVVELVHLLEVGDLVQVADVEDGEVFDAVGDSCFGGGVSWDEKIGAKSNGRPGEAEAYCRGPHPGACSRRPSLDQSGSRPGALLHP